MKKIYILDTTLRDGEQAPGMALIPEEKGKIAAILDDIGIDIIEVGFPAASQIDFESVIECCSKIKRGIPCVFSRLNEKDIDVAVASLRNSYPRMIHLTTSLNRDVIKKILKINERDLIKLALEYIKYLRQQSFYVEIGAADAFIANRNFLIDFYIALSEAGVDVINIADTKGIATPDSVFLLISSLCSFVKKSKVNTTRLSIHCHDDYGLGIANTLKAIEAGVTQVETCILGVGERAGNTSLETISSLLKKNGYKTNIDHRKLIDVTRKISVIMCVPIKQFAPISGINVNAHSAGMHQREMLDINNRKDSPNNYNSLENKIIISRHSGKRGILKKVEELTNIKLKKEDLNLIEAKLKKSKKRIVGVTDLLKILKNLKLYKKHIKEIKTVSVKFKDNKYEISLLTSKKRYKIISNNSIDGLFRGLEKIFKIRVEIQYYTTAEVGNNSNHNTFFYIEVKRRNKKYTSTAYSNNTFIAAITAYLDIVNEIIAKGKV
ncbi:MAG: hypothetical protein N2053_00845 [Chitinispirillaceae bacterium]|nr:hypothetical protein [Chitinispirillaceae bacterium]